MSDNGDQPAEVAVTSQANPSSGKRKVSARLLTPSDSDSYGSLSSSSSGAASASLRLRGFISPSSAQDFELPDDPESVAALEFIGFTQATAREIYQRWEARPDPEQYPYSFLEHATGQFENRNQGDMSHADFMTKVGLDKEFQDAILDPRYASIFGTETLKFWIKDTLASRHHTIAYLQRRYRNMALRGDGGGGHRETRPSLLDDSSVFARGQGGPSNMPKQDPTESLSMSAIAKDLNIPENNVRIGAPAAALDDHQILYKGRVAHTDEDMPFIGPDGSINLTSIDTPAGGDFNARELASYWTPEEATAELYRGYAERRDAYAETWIISIQVPNSLMETLRQTSLWYSADWKEYVIEGHICCKLSQINSRLEPQDVQTRITEDFCLVYTGQDGQTGKCTQRVFIGDDTIVQLSMAVRGKVHIDVHASSTLKELNS
ncbi:hypothetical protein SLS53_007453 [Cytospora paraplurivora]|uniref:Uncharacterized protein n=1 Tax=Cytospora paraplurivora TaxID=2898453 RepID=A0AAN9U0H9_9PEZI